MSRACVIARNARFEGLLSFERSARVEGELIGDVVGEGILVVADGARVEGDIEVAELRVEGELRGEARARDKIAVGPRAQVRARLETATLEVREGASIEGPVTMSRAAAPPG